MQRLLVFTVAAVLGAGAGYVLAQTPAKTAAPQPTKAAVSTPAPAAQTPAKITYPPIPNPGFTPARPIDQVRAVYEFAALHPEILKWVPCFCGCEADGHTDNDTCFVKRRDAKGNVVEWEPHGFGCQVCIDVGREAMMMYRSGADPVAIRAAIERNWTPKAQRKTPTPMPPPRKQ
jgi:hypothetical protein